MTNRPPGATGPNDAGTALSARDNRRPRHQAERAGSHERRARTCRRVGADGRKLADIVATFAVFRRDDQSSKTPAIRRIARRGGGETGTGSVQRSGALRWRPL